MRGIQRSVTHDGVHILRLHYTADPDKDPSTQHGKEWLAREKVGYPGGRRDPRWRREMEIDFEAYAGQLLFPYLIEYEDAILCEPISAIPKSWELSAGFDYGTRNPSAFELTGWDKDGNPTTFWEYYEAPQRKDEKEDDFRARKGYVIVAKALKTSPWWEEVLQRKTVVSADSSIWNKTQETKAGMKSIAELLAEEGVFFSPASKGKGSDMAWYEMVSKKFWVNPKIPKWRITRDCTWLYKELCGLRFAEHSPSAAEVKNPKDEIVDKNNHSVDAVKYDFLAHFSVKDTDAQNTQTVVQGMFGG